MRNPFAKLKNLVSLTLSGSSTWAVPGLLYIHLTKSLRPKMVRISMKIPTVFSFGITETVNRPRTAKVGAISKAQNLKGGPFGLCETPAGCKKFLKNRRGDPLDMKKFPKKFFLMRFLNSVTVPKNVKGGDIF